MSRGYGVYLPAGWHMVDTGQTIYLRSHTGGVIEVDKNALDRWALLPKPASDTQWSDNAMTYRAGDKVVELGTGKVLTVCEVGQDDQLGNVLVREGPATVNDRPTPKHWISIGKVLRHG